MSQDRGDRNWGFPRQDDEIALVGVANMILRNWRLVTTLPVVLALLVGVWTRIQAPRYAAISSFMPQVTEGRAMGNASALAQQFGLSLATERPGQSPQFYMDLLRSRTLLQQAVVAEYQLPLENGETWVGTLASYWDLADNSRGRESSHRAIDRLRDAISTSVNRETGVIEFSVSTDHPILSERIAAKLLELLNEYNLEVRRARAQAEARFISSRIADAQSELLATENALLEFLRQNRQFENSPELIFEHDRLQRNVIMRQEVFTSLLRAQEQTQIDAVRDTPLFTVLDQPTGSAEQQSRRTILSALLAFVLGVLLAVSIAFFREFARRSRAVQDPSYTEFQTLVRLAWEDLRHPLRWIRSKQPSGVTADR